MCPLYACLRLLPCTDLSIRITSANNDSRTDVINTFIGGLVSRSTIDIAVLYIDMYIYIYERPSLCFL